MPKVTTAGEVEEQTFQYSSLTSPYVAEQSDIGYCDVITPESTEILSPAHPPPFHRPPLQPSPPLNSETEEVNVSSSVPIQFSSFICGVWQKWQIYKKPRFNGKSF